MPASIQPFVDAIGPSATLSVIRAFGGGRLYIPKADRLDESHPLVRLLGLPLALRLAQAVGGERHEVASASTIEAMVRNEEIRRRFRSGASVRQLALHFGLSTRTVWRAINETNVTPDREPA